MVDVSSQNSSVSINVSSSGNSASIKASPDTAQYYSEKSREYAISDKLIDGKDYSSKYYANKSAISESNAKDYAQSSQDTYNQFQQSVDGALSNVDIAVQGAVESINTKSVEAIDNINSTKTTILSDIEFVADGEKKEIEDLIDNGKEELKESIGDVKVLTTLKIGQIGIAPLGIDETLNMERYLNGQIIIQDQFKGFTQFLKKRVTLYPSIACLEDEWQNIVANSDFSQCGKFVIDDNAGTIRLPKVVNIQGLTDLSKLGEIVEAGLPNITGNQLTGVNSGNDYVANVGGGAFKNNTVYYTASGAYGAESAQVRNWFTQLNFDASNSNPIYSKSNTVQQEQIQYPYFIQVATGAETEDNIVNDIELNNPFSLLDYKYSEYELNNLSWLRSNGQYNSKAVYPAVYDLLLKIYNGTETKAGVSVKLSTETFTDYDFVLNTAEETFRLPVKVKLASGKAVVGNGQALVGLQNLTAPSISKPEFYFGKNPSNDDVTIWNSAQTQSAIGITTDATKSGIETSDNDLYLYFYVGETVQNANLINAGRIEEKLANKQDKCIHIIDTYVNGTSGYRIWSDGYCEQWGNYQGTNITNHVINLLINFKDTTYITFANTNYNTGLQRGVAYTVNTNKTVGHFQIYSADFAPGQLNCDWLACGYIR